MKKPFKKVLVSGALTACLLGVAGAAHAEGTVLAALSTPVSPEDSSTIDQRLAARKTAYKSQLPPAANADIAAKCVLAQTAMTDLRAKDVKAAAIRLDAYTALSKRLAYLVDNLSGQNLDATLLLNAQNDFVGSLNTYLVDASNYKAAIDDAINVDCKQDPAGFRASLLEARKTRDQLASDAAAAKSKVGELNKALSAERQLLIKNPGKVTAGSVGTRTN